MNLGIEKRTALVTGASRGIGAAICQTLAREGVNIIAVARSEEDLESLRMSLHKGNHHFVVADLSCDGVIDGVMDGVTDVDGVIPVSYTHLTLPTKRIV